MEAWDIYDDDNYGVNNYDDSDDLDVDRLCEEAWIDALEK